MRTRASSINLVVAIAISCVILGCSANPNEPLEAKAARVRPVGPVTEYTRLIAQLGAPDFASRDEADRQLRTIGWQAMNALIIARNDVTNEESKMRLQTILSDLCHDGDPDDLWVQGRCDAILGLGDGTLIHRRGAGWSVKDMQHVAELKRRNSWPQLEWELYGMSRLSDLCLAFAQRKGEVDPFLAAIRTDALRQAAPSDSTKAFPADFFGENLYAIPEPIDIPTVEPARLPEFRADAIAIPILNAAGRQEEARQLAEKWPRQTHDYERMLAEQKDWPTLARFPVLHDFFNMSRFIPAGALLFSGRTAECDALIDRNSKAANGLEPLTLSRQLVILGRTDLMNKACRERGDQTCLIDFLLRERRYREAMNCHTKIGGPKDDLGGQCDSELVLALIKLNEIESARLETARLQKSGESNGFLKTAITMLAGSKPDIGTKALAPRSASSNEEPGHQFLAGVQAVRDGNIDAGLKMQSDAELLLGGDIDRRLALASELHAMGESKLAREQAELVNVIAPPAGKPRMAAHEMLAEIDQAEGHFAEALQHYRLEYFASFYDHIELPDDYDLYFEMARSSAYCQASVALQASKADDAFMFAKEVIEKDCEGLGLTLSIIKAFERAGLRTQAMQLAQINRTMLEDILRDFPNSHLHHYLIARLDLESGLVNETTALHARRAQELAPDNELYRSLGKN